jgi:hypothetical protein
MQIFFLGSHRQDLLGVPFHPAQICPRLMAWRSAQQVCSHRWTCAPVPGATPSLRSHREPRLRVGSLSGKQYSCSAVCVMRTKDVFKMVYT